MMRLADLQMAERAQAALTMASAVVLMGSVAVACSTARLPSGKSVFLVSLCTGSSIMKAANFMIAKWITVHAIPVRREGELRTFGRFARKGFSKLYPRNSRVKCEVSMLVW